MKYYVALLGNGRWKTSKDMIWGEGHLFRTHLDASSSAEAIRKAKKILKSKGKY